MDIELPKIDKEQSPIDNKQTLGIKNKRSNTKMIVLSVLSGLLLLTVLVAGSSYLWYRSQLSAVDASSTEEIQIVIKQGDTFNDLSNQLEQKGLIKNAFALQLYNKLNKHVSSLQVGTYVFSKRQTPVQMLEELQKGAVSNEFQITFKPGENIFDARKVLLEAGYNEVDIDAAFKKQYDKYPMMAGRPADASVEGFILGETYSATKEYTVENILDMPFSLLQQYIDKEGLEAAFNKHGLTLYEGIILASIIQREVSNPDDMLLVSSVFHNRLKKGMQLGSDVTAAYGVQVLGKSTSVVEAVTVDTPYNTRIHTGLPPAPIASPGMRALRAAANPAESEYIYFVAGDDGKTYFAVTNEEHESNAKKYCNKLCKL